MTRAPSGDKNQCWFRHSSRILPLIDSITALSEGFPGLLKSSFAPFDLPPLNVATFRERISGGDAAPNLVPAELLAMQGRYLGMPR